MKIERRRFTDCVKEDRRERLCLFSSRREASFEPGELLSVAVEKMLARMASCSLLLSVGSPPFDAAAANTISALVELGFLDIQELPPSSKCRNPRCQILSMAVGPNLKAPPRLDRGSEPKQRS